jgi:hypothetical protein
MGEVTVRQGTWTLEDRFASVYQYLPVEVPAGTSALCVKLEYSREGTVLDLGCFGPSGFRGWSGGARDSFVIGTETAVPGYLPGELEAGTWQVVLGLHQLPAEGAQYRVTAETASRRCPRRGRSGARICRPHRGGGGWPGTCTRTPSTPTA